MAMYDIIFPANKRLQFDGGKNNKYEKHIIQDNESPDCLNVIFENGSVATRGGSTRLNSGAVGSFVGEGLYVRNERSTGAESMCAWFNGSMFVWNGTSFATVASAQSVFTAGGRVGSAEQENYIYFGNGYADPYKYNGTDFTLHGIKAPTTTLTAATGAAGTPNGIYSYKVTFVNSALVEGNVSPVSNTITVASTRVELTSIPTAAQSWGVASRKVYRTTNSGTTYLLLTTLADNTTTTYSDNIADASLGATAPTDNGTPPQYSFCLSHQKRLFCNDLDNPSYIWYSDLDNPYVFGATNFITFGDNSGELVRALAVYDNNIVVGTDRGMWIIYMSDTDDTNWVRVRTKSPYGCKSPFGIFEYNNKLMFPAVQNSKFVGFAALSGDTVEPDATLLTVSAAGSELKSDRIEPDIFDVQSAYIDRISASVYKNKAYISLTKESPNTTNNRIVEFDFSISNLSKQQQASWSLDTGISATQMAIYSGTLYFQSSTALGRVYSMNTSTYNDDGSAINSYIWTKEFSGVPGHEQYLKDFRYVNVLYEKSGDWFMKMNYRVDGDEGDGNSVNIDLDPGSNLWGTLVFGTDDWGGGTDTGEERIRLGQLRGKRIQFKFSNQNTVAQKFKVIGLQIGYNLVGRR
jgi:hypothetical protein